jgi:hypothetical protein
MNQFMALPGTTRRRLHRLALRQNECRAMADKDQDIAADFLLSVLPILFLSVLIRPAL